MVISRYFQTLWLIKVMGTIVEFWVETGLSAEVVSESYSTTFSLDLDDISAITD